MTNEKIYYAVRIQEDGEIKEFSHYKGGCTGTDIIVFVGENEGYHFDNYFQASNLRWQLKKSGYWQCWVVKIKYTEVDSAYEMEIE